MVLSNRAKARRKEVRNKRATLRIYNCRKCNKHLDFSDVHHTLCNKCWKAEHPREVMIDSRKRRYRN